MQPLIAPADMRDCEKEYFETSGVPSIAVMENAATALFRLVLNRFPEARRICIACGPGGNGGDGYACARLLHQRDKRVIVFPCAPAKSPDALENARRAAQCGVDILPAARMEGMPRPDLWIDCLYGTGLSRLPEGDAARLIRRMNFDHDRGCGVIACDIPSGLNGSTGRAFSPCVQADVTLALQIAKYGYFLQDGLDVCGEVCVADVGFPENIFPKNPVRLLEPGDLPGLLPSRRRNIHKGDCGHLLIIAGSVGMAGAAALCAKAALRSGAGLVTIACPQEILPLMQLHAPCAMGIPLPQKDGAICAEALPVLRNAFMGKSAVVIGPGLSRRVPPEIIGAVLESGLPAVIDADALNILSENPELRALLNARHVLTPHPGEAARLLGHACQNPIQDAQELSAMGCIAVFKGASRVISGAGACLVSASGAGGMARGGSGDVFAGILGALLAEEMPTPERVACACEIHGLAGVRAQNSYGSRGMNAADLIECLPEVFVTHGN